MEERTKEILRRVRIFCSSRESTVLACYMKPGLLFFIPRSIEPLPELSEALTNLELRLSRDFSNFGMTLLQVPNKKDAKVSAFMVDSRKVWPQDD